MSTTEKHRYADSERAAFRASADADSLGFENETDFADLVDGLNELASKAVAGFCGRHFNHVENDTVAIDGNGRRSIRLPGYPVIDVGSVTVNGREVDPDSYRVKDAEALSTSNGGVLERRHNVWPDGWRNVEVTYSWGYKEPPAPVVDATETLVIDALEQALNAQNAEGAVDTFSLEGFNVSFAEPIRFSVDGERFPNLKRYGRVGVA